jgi:hypothetical protein
MNPPKQLPPKLPIWKASVSFGHPLNLSVFAAIIIVVGNCIFRNRLQCSACFSNAYPAERSEL